MLAVRVELESSRPKENHKNCKHAAAQLVGSIECAGGNDAGVEILEANGYDKRPGSNNKMWFYSMTVMDNVIASIC